MKNIIEINFKANENKLLADLLIDSFRDNWNDNFYNYYVYLVYIDTRPIQVIYTSVSTNELNEAPEPTFLESLEMINHSEFDEVLLLVSTFPDFKNINTLASNSSLDKNPHLDKLFKETNGWLIFDYQLEKLYLMSINNNEDKAIQFRKNINKKLYSKTEKFCKTEIFGTSIKDILSERMKLGVVYRPQFDGAYKLYQYLNK